MSLKHWMLALVAAALAACGTPGPGTMDQSETSVTPTPDRVNPGEDADQPDSPSPADAPSADVPTPTEDVQVTMPDVPPTEECWRRLCGMVLAIEMDETTRTVQISCTPGSTTIDLQVAFPGCAANCSGDRCSCAIKDGSGDTGEFVNDHPSGAACTNDFAVNAMRGGRPMARTSGVVRLRRL